jgi:hypothetical protein
MGTSEFEIAKKRAEKRLLMFYISSLNSIGTKGYIFYLMVC